MTPEQTYYERIMDYQATFVEGRGRNVLDDLRAQYCHRSSFVSGDPYATAFREGQRDVVLAIESVLKTAADREFSLETVFTYLNQGDEDNG